MDHSLLDKLAEADRCQVESLLVAYDISWAEGRLMEEVNRLPAPASSLRVAALLGIVKIDLQRSWRQGSRCLAEDYLRRFPELRASEEAVTELSVAESQVRHQFGDVAPALEPEPPACATSPLAVSMAGNPAANTVTGPKEELCSVPDALPEQFGRYFILRCLGQGGMGAVYLAHDSELDRPVALKVPSLEPGDGPRERFLREARAAVALRHPNLCPVYDVNQIDGIPYLTMAYIEGPSLARQLEQEPVWPENRAADLVAKLARALAQTHRAGIIHRELKPANIMMDGSGQPVITDFGLTRRIDTAAPRLTQDGAFVDTPLYMAPEQISGELNETGPPGDVYSLGAILYELLAGRPPFQGRTLDVLVRIRTESPDPPSAYRPGLDPVLEVVCLKAMARRPENRYGTMDDFAEALESYLQTTARPTGAIPLVPTRTVPRRRWPAMFAAVSGLASVVVIIGVWGLSRGSWGDLPREQEGFQAAASLPSGSGEKSEKVSTRVGEQPSGLGDPNHRVRKKAVEALVAEKKDAAVPLLIQRVADDQCDSGFTDDKDAALSALKALAPARVTEALRLALRSGNARTRAWAAERFTEPDSLAPGQAMLAKDAEIVPALCRCLEDKNRLVRAHAAKSLGRCGRNEQTLVAVEPLSKLLAAAQFSGGLPQDKDEALRAISVLAPERVVEAMSNALNSSAAPVRRWAAEQNSFLAEIPEARRPLPAYGKWKADWVQNLIAALEDQESGVREAAAGSLEALRDPAAVSALVKRVADDRFDPRFPTDKDRALQALRILRRMRSTTHWSKPIKSPKKSVSNWAFRKLAESTKKKKK